RNSTQDAPGIVGKKHRAPVIAHAHFVGILFAAQRRGGKAGADLDTLDRVDAHQCGGESAIELAVGRSAEAGRNALRFDFADGAARRAAFADIVEIAFKELGLRRIRTEEWIALDLVPIPTRPLDPVLTHLDERAPHRHAGYDLARDR